MALLVVFLGYLIPYIPGGTYKDNQQFIVYACVSQQEKTEPKFLEGLALVDQSQLENALGQRNNHDYV